MLSLARLWLLHLLKGIEACFHERILRSAARLKQSM